MTLTQVQKQSFKSVRENFELEKGFIIEFKIDSVRLSTNCK